MLFMDWQMYLVTAWQAITVQEVIRRKIPYHAPLDIIVHRVPPRRLLVLLEHLTITQEVLTSQTVRTVHLDITVVNMGCLHPADHAILVFTVLEVKRVCGLLTSLVVLDISVLWAVTTKQAVLQALTNLTGN